MMTMLIATAMMYWAILSFTVGSDTVKYRASTDFNGIF